MQQRFDSLLSARDLLQRLAADAALPSWVKEEAGALLVHYPSPALLHDLAAREALVIRQFPRLGRSAVLTGGADGARAREALSGA